MQRIKEVREKGAISARELAVEVGLTSSAIGHYENERRTPDVNMCWKIVKAFNQLGVDCKFTDVFPSPTTKHHTTQKQT